MTSINSNPFDENSGSASIAKPRALLLLLMAAVLFAVILAKLEMGGLGILFGLILKIHKIVTLRPALRK